VIKTLVVGSMSIVAYKLQISGPHRQRAIQDASWLSAGPAGSRSTAHGPARIVDDRPKDRDQSQWISVPGPEALA
jgi:hypothetical protein